MSNKDSQIVNIFSQITTAPTIFRDTGIDPTSLAKNSPKKGQILIYNGTEIEWCDPFNPDKELREQYPELAVSWQRVLEAISEYELVKKLVDDYD